MRFQPEQQKENAFGIAVDRAYKKGEEKQTDFLNVVCWRTTAEFVSKWFSKGRMAVAEGRMQTRTWKDKHDQSRKTTELVIDNIYFADSKRESEAPPPAGYAPAADEFAELTEDDGELPF